MTNYFSWQVFLSCLPMFQIPTCELLTVSPPVVSPTSTNLGVGVLIVGDVCVAMFGRNSFRNSFGMSIVSKCSPSERYFKMNLVLSE